jgi:hypothetical protein
MTHRPVCIITYIYVSTLLQSHFTTQQAPTRSWTGDDDDDSLGPALWSQQDLEFNNNFLVLDKRDFKSMRDVRKYVLVEIRPEGGRRHNSPLKVLPPPKGKAAEGPPRRKAEKLSY